MKILKGYKNHLLNDCINEAYELNIPFYNGKRLKIYFASK
jgi:predicted GTPase